MGTPELRAAVAAMTDEQRDSTLVLLECNTEELTGLPDGRGIQAIVNMSNLLNFLSVIGFINFLGILKPSTTSSFFAKAHL